MSEKGFLAVPEKTLKASVSMPSMQTLKLGTIPEHSVILTPPAESDDLLSPSVNDEDKLAGRLGLLRDMVTTLEVYKHHEDDHGNVSRHAARLISEFGNDITHVHNMTTKVLANLSREAEIFDPLTVEQIQNQIESYNGLLSVMLEVPNHIKAGLKAQPLTKLPYGEANGYKLDLEAKLAKSYELRLDIEAKISSLESKLGDEKQAAVDDFTIISHRKIGNDNGKNGGLNAYDTRPKRFQSARY